MVENGGTVQKQSGAKRLLAHGQTQTTRQSEKVCLPSRNASKNLK